MQCETTFVVHECNCGRPSIGLLGETVCFERKLPLLKKEVLVCCSGIQLRFGKLLWTLELIFFALAYPPLCS